jgi:putative transposase
MSNYKTLQHAEWDRKYPVVFIPKYRRKVLYGTIRDYLGEIFRRLARQKKCEIEEGIWWRTPFI